jgi:hypothetical protein
MPIHDDGHGVIHFDVVGGRHENADLSNYDVDTLQILQSFRRRNRGKLVSNADVSAPRAMPFSTLTKEEREQRRAVPYEIRSYTVNERWIRTRVGGPPEPGSEAEARRPLTDVPPLVPKALWDEECSSSRTSIPMEMLRSALGRFRQPEGAANRKMLRVSGDSLDIRASIKTGSNYLDHTRGGRPVARPRYRPRMMFNSCARPRGSLNLLALAEPAPSAETWENPDVAHAHVDGASWLKGRSQRGRLEALPGQEDGDRFTALASWCPAPGEEHSIEAAEADAESRARAKKSVEDMVGAAARAKRALGGPATSDGARHALRATQGRVDLDAFDAETGRLLRLQNAASADLRRLDMWLKKTAGVLREEQLFR